MEGNQDNPGLNQRLLAHLFDSLMLRGSVVSDPESMAKFRNEPDSTTWYYIAIGVYEIYNETIRDLGQVGQPHLDIRADPETGEIGLPHLHMEVAFSSTHAFDILSQAQKNRATNRTNVHENSSRSHSVVVIQVKSTSGPCGTMYLVDLAGSERVKISGVNGGALKETAAINKSLSALGDVMEALEKKHSHVPYRNSKLTYALQDVLGGRQSKTVMILNVAPGFSTASETFRSMMFAERVRRVVTVQGIKPQPQRGLLSGKEAFTEIKALKQQLAQANTRALQFNQTTALMVCNLSTVFKRE
jgi:kinesin family protein C2/C3